MTVAGSDAFGPAIFFGAFFIVWIAFVGANFGLWLWGLIDACQRPEWAFGHAGSSKTMWIVLIALLGGIPALIYLISVRPRVRHVQESFLATAAQPANAPGARAAPTGFCTACGTPFGGPSRFCGRCGKPR